MYFEAKIVKNVEKKYFQVSFQACRADRRSGNLGVKSVINQFLLVFASNVDKIKAGSNAH